jgi:hypothetical protein
MQGRGVGGFMIDQLQHLARLRGCTHLVLEVAENNRDALTFYKHRGFQKMDAAIFMAQKIDSAPDLLPPRKLKGRGADDLPENAAVLEDGETVSLEVALPGKPIKSSLPKKKKPKKRAAKKRSSERPKRAPASQN